MFGDIHIHMKYIMSLSIYLHTLFPYVISVPTLKHHIQLQMCFIIELLHRWQMHTGLEIFLPIPHGYLLHVVFTQQIEIYACYETTIIKILCFVNELNQAKSGIFMIVFP